MSTTGTTIIPEDFDDDDYPYASSGFHQYHKNNSTTDSIYEDRSKLQLAGLRETSLSQIEGKKRFRPPTLIIPSFMQPSMPQSPSVLSFHSGSSGERSSIYPAQASQQQQYYNYHHQNQQQMQMQYYLQQQQQQQFRPQQYYPQQQQQQQQPQQFQPPIHYKNMQRSSNTLISPPSSTTYLGQPPIRRSLTPSSIYDNDRVSLPITPESSEDVDENNVVTDLKRQNEDLNNSNDKLMSKISALEKLLNDKQQELQLKDNILDAKTKQLNLREEKLNNKDKQIEQLNKKMADFNMVSDELTITKLELENHELQAKVTELTKKTESFKSIEHDRLAQVNKDLSRKILALLEENELLKSKQNSSSSSSSSSLVVPQQQFHAPSPRLASNGKTPKASTKTLKDFSKEEIFKLEFLHLIEMFNQNQIHYSTKINSLQEIVAQQRKMIKSLAHTRKHLNTFSDGRRGFKVIRIVPSTF